MSHINKYFQPQNHGSALLISMIFIVICSALALSLAAMSGSNTQLANNQHKIDYAFASAESGLDIQRYWLTPVMMPSATAPSDYFSTIVDTIQYDLDDNSITNIVLHNDGSIDAVALDSPSKQTFSGQLSIDSSDLYTLHVYSTGGNGQITRTIKVEYAIEP